MKLRIAQWSLVLSIALIIFTVVGLQLRVASLTQQLEECESKCSVRGEQ